MKRLFFLAGLLFFVAQAHSQKAYFIYLQSESGQAFFARLKEQTYSANSSGYLILPQLTDSTHLLKIGFPANKWPEQQFQVPVNGKDRGFLLKNFGEKGWGLFDLQTMALIMAMEPAKDNSVITSPKEVSAFTETLSRAANDPSLKLRTVVVKTEDKPAVVQAAVVKESIPEPGQVSAVSDPKMTTSVPIGSGTDAKKPDSNVVATTTEPKESVAVPIGTSAVPEQKKPESNPVSPVTDPKVTAAVPIGTSAADQKKSDSNTSVKTEEAKDTLAAAAVTTNSKDPVAETKKEESVKEPAAQNNPESKPVETNQAANKDPEVTANKVVTTPEGIATPILVDNREEGKKEAGYEKSVVTRKSESSTTEGFGAVYLDRYADGHYDTIRIVIPNPKVAFVKPVEETATAKQTQVGEQNAVQNKPVGPVADNNLSKTATKSKFQPCKAVSTESEFLQLRKRMAGVKGDEEKIKESRKAFKTRCYSTAQIKNLGNLFANEAGKFQFYEGAYPFVADREAYSELQSEFSDTYFIYRFKNLIAN